MKMRFEYLENTKVYVLFIDDVAWAVRDTLVELVVIANAAYAFGKERCF